jgi:hypothetical protein
MIVLTLVTMAVVALALVYATYCEYEIEIRIGPARADDGDDKAVEGGPSDV